MPPPISPRAPVTTPRFPLPRVLPFSMPACRTHSDQPPSTPCWGYFGVGASECCMLAEVLGEGMIHPFMTMHMQPPVGFGRARSSGRYQAAAGRAIWGKPGGITALTCTSNLAPSSLNEQRLACCADGVKYYHPNNRSIAGTSLLAPLATVYAMVCVCICTAHIYHRMSAIVHTI